MIIPFFLRNRGCPHRCRFCNQEISGGADPRKLGAGYFHEKVRAFLTSAARGKKPGQPVEIAFYGGNFTGLTPEEREDLLHGPAAYGKRHRRRDPRLDRPGACATRMWNDWRLRVGPWKSAPSPWSTAYWPPPAEGIPPGCSRRRGVLKHRAGGHPPSHGGPARRRWQPSWIPFPGRQRLDPRCAYHPTLVLASSPLAEDFLQGRYVPLTLPEAVDLCRQAWDILENRASPSSPGSPGNGYPQRPQRRMSGYHPPSGPWSLRRAGERAWPFLGNRSRAGRRSFVPGEKAPFADINCNIKFLRNLPPRRLGNQRRGTSIICG